MPIKVRQTKRGVTVRATGRDAHGIFMAVLQAIEPARLTPGEAELLKCPAEPPESIPGDPKLKAACPGAAPAVGPFTAAGLERP